MIRAKCPFCGEENLVGLGELRPEPTEVMKTCRHFAFFSPTRYMGVQYAQEEFSVNFGARPGATAWTPT